MKKLLLIALLLLGVAAGVLFIDTTPHAPLEIRITGMTNQEAGGVNIYFTVSNQTDHPYSFFAYPQALSNGVWFTSVDDRAPFGGVKGVCAHTNSEEIVYTYRNRGTMHLQVTCMRLTAPPQSMIDKLVQKLRRSLFHGDGGRRELITPPFEIPSR